MNAEGERGGAEVAAAESEADLRRRVEQLADLAAEHISCSGCPTPWWLKNWLMDTRARAALADPAGALAKHDAEVLRAAADEVDSGPTFPLPPSVLSALLRERADRIAGGQS